MGAAAPITSFADSKANNNSDNHKIVELNNMGEEESMDEEEPIVIEIDALDFKEKLESYGINENSSDEEIGIAVDKILENEPSLLAHCLPEGGSLPSSPSIGQTKNVIVKISNTDILGIAGLAYVSSGILQKAFKALTTKFFAYGNAFSGLATAVAGINAMAGYSGFSRYK